MQAIDFCPMAIERRRLIVRGRVQGVGFRYFARDAGRGLGLDGWVRNLPDGRSVEAEVQGEKTKLDTFESLVREGPPGSFVSEFTASRVPAVDGAPGFEIAR